MSKSKNKKYYTSNKTNFIPPNQNQKKDKKGIAFWVLFSLIIFWTISSVLGSLSFFNVNYSSDIPTAKADGVQQNYVYRGKNQFVPTSTYYKSGGWLYPSTNHPTYIASYDFIVRLVPTGDFAEPSYLPYLNSTMPVLSVKGYLNRAYPPFNYSAYGSLMRMDNPLGDAPTYIDTFNGQNTDYESFGKLRFDVTYDDNLQEVIPTGDMFYSAYYLSTIPAEGYNDYYSFIYYEGKQTFNANVVRVTFSSIDNYDIFTHDIYGARIFANVITLYDNNGNYISIYFISQWNHDYAPISSLLWEERTYFITSDMEESSAYQNGKADGYAEGKKDYEGSGFQDGYNQGKSDGESIGYNKGVSEANNYSFLSLMGAVVDAPIQALTGFFGFEILGINLLSLLSGLFTLCIIIILIRLLLGGGFSG